MADQFRADVMSCAGGPARTPNLDAIAAEGVRFSQCVTPSPVCVPARISLFSGKYPHTTGVWRNGGCVLSTQANIWSKAFRELGYDTSLFGKTHLHTHFGDLTQREYLLHGYGFDTVNEVAGPKATCKTSTHMSKEWEEKGLYQAYCEDLCSRGRPPMVKPTTLPLEDYYDVYVGRKGDEYLQSYRGDKPWFCHVSFGGPHEPWDTPEPYASMYAPKDMPAPYPPMTDACPGRPEGVADKQMKNPLLQCSPELAADLRADYCGGVTLIDEMIGRIIDTIKRRGEWENTVVLFTSDHGEMNGDQGFVRKCNFFRSAVDIPLIIRTPETAAKGGAVSDALANLLDVGPTLVELAGGKLDYPQFGKSLCGILNGTEQSVREGVISEYQGEILYMDQDWKMAVNAAGQVYLLFDRKNDPNEQHNLAGSPQVRDLTASLREKMMCALAQTQCLAHAPILDFQAVDPKLY